MANIDAIIDSFEVSRKMSLFWLQHQSGLTYINDFKASGYKVYVAEFL
jgi:hypothetical protein